MAFPPSAQTSLQTILAPYVYQQFSDDNNIQAFNASATQLFQAYLDWFNNTPLPIYTNAAIAGPLLDWVAQGIYGISRPSLPYGRVTNVGEYNTYQFNTLQFNAATASGSVMDFTTTDDIFKRIITWFFFKGDGQQFCTTWLKRRIMRFLTGTAGTAPNIGDTYPVSVAFAGSGAVTITITYDGTIVTKALAQVLQAAIASGAVSLPFQLTFTVNLTA